MKRQETYFTTRPRLAAYLLERGHEGELTTNPYRPDKAAWIFTRTEELDADVDDYYVREGRGES